MTRNVRACRPGDALSTAAQMMWEGDCGCVPVVDGENGDARAVGIITDRDICMAGYTQGRPLSAIRVDSALARQVYSCRPTDSVGEALNVLRQRQIRRLPVVDNGDHLVGMLSPADAAHELAQTGVGASTAAAADAAAVELPLLGAPSGFATWRAGGQR